MVIDLSAFVDALGRNLPAGFTVELRGRGAVVFVGPAGQPAIVDVSDAVRRGAASAAVSVVMSSVQDHVTIEMRRPWPEQDGNLALPELREADGHIEAWFGPRERRALKLGIFPIFADE